MKDKYIKNVALNLKLKISDSMLKEINREWDFFNESLKILDEIDTENVKPFYLHNYKNRNYLREDIPSKSDFNREVIFDNNSNFKDNYFIIEKDLT